MVPIAMSSPRRELPRGSGRRAASLLLALAPSVGGLFSCAGDEGSTKVSNATVTVVGDSAGDLAQKAPSAPDTAAPAIDVRFEFVSFGELRPLAQADRIVEATPLSISELPNGTVVVRFRRVASMLPPSTDTTATLLESDELVVLAGRDEFRAGSDYLLFLRSFRGGSRYVALQRIASGDRDYEAKKRVLTAYAAIDRIPSETDRVAKIRDLLLVNIGDQADFVRWNALTELKALAQIRADVFTAENRARLVAAANAEHGDVFRNELCGVLKLLGIDMERTARG